MLNGTYNNVLQRNEWGGGTRAIGNGKVNGFGEMPPSRQVEMREWGRKQDEYVGGEYRKV